MAESKSAALTSLATPQALTLIQKFLKRMAIQPPRSEAPHFGGHSGQDRARFALGREFDEHTGAGSAHTRIAELLQPSKMRRHFRVAPAHDRFQIIPSETRRKA